MTPRIPPFFSAPTVRRTCYQVVSLLVITSLILQPMAAVAVIYRTEAVLRAATLAAANRPIAAPVRLLPQVDQTAAQTAIARTIHPMPQPRLRTAAWANPTPSGAKPAYPLNHVLDANPQSVGTPPTNYNFETAGYYVGTPPTNADLSAAVTEVGTPPTNQDFATGDLTGWTTSGTVTIQSDATYSNYARLQSSAVLVSDAFTVDSAAQQIAFAIGYFSSAAINLYVLSGAGYSTRTKIDYLYCNTCGWTTYTLDAAAYSGQSIKLEFNRAGGTLGIDNLQMRILLPGYTVQNPIERVEQSNGNVYARLGYNGLLTSAAFTVETSAQVATVDVSGLTTASDQYRIDVLSGPTYATVTQAAVNTSTPDSWQRVQLNLATWQGQSVKLRIKGLYGAVGFDNIGVQSVFLPDWQFSGTATVGDDGDGNHYVATAGNLVSAPFTLDVNLQQITLRHRSGKAVVNRFELKLLRGANFSQEVDLTGGQVTSNPGAWQTFKLALNLYAGETVKLKLVAIGPMHFDDAGLGENLLPGWQLTNDGAIATGTDSYGSYVTAANSGLFAVRSSEMTTGIINRSTSVDRRYYAVAYDIGYVTGSLLRVYWVDAQGYSIQLMQDAANTPTGYRERYFWISDAQAQTGRLVVSLAGQANSTA